MAEAVVFQPRLILPPACCATVLQGDVAHVGPSLWTRLFASTLVIPPLTNETASGEGNAVLPLPLQRPSASSNQGRSWRVLPSSLVCGPWGAPAGRIGGVPCSSPACASQAHRPYRLEDLGGKLLAQVRGQPSFPLKRYVHRGVVARLLALARSRRRYLYQAVRNMDGKSPLTCMRRRPSAPAARHTRPAIRAAECPNRGKPGRWTGHRRRQANPGRSP